MGNAFLSKCFHSMNAIHRTIATFPFCVICFTDSESFLLLYSIQTFSVALSRSSDRQ